MNKALKSQIRAASETPDFARVLAIVIHQFTVFARLYRDATVTSEAALRRLKVTNELIHQMSSKLRGELDETPQYPDDVFIEILIETAGDECAAELDRAFKFALEQTKVHPLR